MAGRDGLILWVLGGAGTLFIYAAYKNETPQSVLMSHIGGSKTPLIPISPSPKPDASNSPPGDGFSLDRSVHSLDNGTKLNSGLATGSSGTINAYDPITGLALGPIPSIYQHSPNTFITPSNGVMYA